MVGVLRFRNLRERSQLNRKRKKDLNYAVNGGKFAEIIYWNSIYFSEWMYCASRYLL